MLKVTRNVSEGIRVGDDVLIRVLGFFQNQAGEWEAEIGILAPQAKRILREELWNANQIDAAGEQ
jgi:carbon storage regulator CsrA